MVIVKKKKAVESKSPDYKKALDRLNEQSKRGGGGDRSYMDLEQGKNFCRVLPGHPNMDGFYEEVYYHGRSLGKKGRLSVICLNHGDYDGDECPICEELKAYRSSKDKSDKAIWNEQRPKARFFMNVIDRRDNQIKILGAGISIMKGILGYVTDEEYGDILDPMEGTDLIITRTGEQLDTEYDVKAKRKSSPALDDDDAVEALIGTDAKDTQLNDLTEMKATFAGEPDKAELVWKEGWEALKDLEEDTKDSKTKSKKSSKKVEDDDDEEEEEEAKPVKKAKPAPPVKKKAKPVEDDEDEDEEEEEEEVKPKKAKPAPAPVSKKKPVVEEDDDEDDEEEEEEEEEVKPKKKAKAPEPVKKSSKKVVEEDDDEEDDLDDLDAILAASKKKGKK